MENPQPAYEPNSKYPSFEYPPLESPTMIRLIEVRPERMGGLIVVVMHHANLPPPRPKQWNYSERTVTGSDATRNEITSVYKRRERMKPASPPEDLEAVPNYRCLSYTWGDSSANHKILINGCVLNVRRNLFEFLEVATAVPEPIALDRCVMHQSRELTGEEPSSAEDGEHLQTRQGGSAMARKL